MEQREARIRSGRAALRETNGETKAPPISPGGASLWRRSVSALPAGAGPDQGGVKLPRFRGVFDVSVDYGSALTTSIMAS